MTRFDLLSLLELAAAALILGGGVWLYRRRTPEGEGQPDDRHYDTQGAVLLLVFAVILAIHGSGALNYHPSASEREMYEGLKGMSGH
ncbi:MAG TPA: hypothetical protein VF079_02040 [Sphingomicrobium sp.]